MKTRSFVALAAALAVAPLTLAHAQTKKTTTSFKSQRDAAEATAKKNVPGLIVTRRDNGNGPKSGAHGEGRAFDFVSGAKTQAARAAEAKTLSSKQKANVTVIVETVVGHKGGKHQVYGPIADKHDIYRQGNLVKSTFVKARATGNHTHVQIDKQVKSSKPVVSKPSTSSVKKSSVVRSAPVKTTAVYRSTTTSTLRSPLRTPVRTSTVKSSTFKGTSSFKSTSAFRSTSAFKSTSSAKKSTSFSVKSVSKSSGAKSFSTAKTSSARQTASKPATKTSAPKSSPRRK